MTRHFIIKLYVYKPNRIKILRPFIKNFRFELIQFCEFWNLPIRPDSTNFKFDYKRNRVRLQLLPYIKYFFNSNLLKIIIQIQKILFIENQYYDLIIKKVFPWGLNSFFYLPKIFQYRIIHNLLISFNKKICFNEVNKIFYKIQK
uniref:tRNA(Ile)-lysidine/2-thiocytidine synthase N-terminal domain-containing protein n=1 Tax=Caulerpa cliftonii TaxID=1004391 RepID=A0A1C9JBL4_9CHLO|nr:hypothetical protein [Caulerpa cliftonii]AOP19236.1 hypothetical protein [Caulerpa cliftonii]